MDTSELISRLADELTPVRRLEGPERRMLRSGFAVVLVIAVALLIGGPEGSLASAASGVIPSIFLAGLTSLLAAYGAYTAGAPARSFWPAALAALALLAWWGVLESEAVRQWAAAGYPARMLVPSVDCVVTTLVLSLPLLVAFVAQALHSISAHPALAGAMGGLAAAGGAWVGTRILIPHPYSMAMDVFTEQVSAMVVFAALGAALGVAVVGNIAPIPLKGSKKA